jgi:hypothetical protein
MDLRDSLEKAEPYSLVLVATFTGPPGAFAADIKKGRHDGALINVWVLLSAVSRRAGKGKSNRHGRARRHRQIVRFAPLNGCDGRGD